MKRPHDGRPHGTIGERPAFAAGSCATERARQGGDPGGDAEHFLHLIENHAPWGSWCWLFESGAQAWSPGLYRLLGLAATRPPSYALLRDCAHPEDRDRLPGAAELRHGLMAETPAFRIVRPDGAIRHLSARNELVVGPDGRPVSARGVLRDITDETALRGTLDAGRRRSAALARHEFVLSYRSPESDMDVVTFDAPDMLAPNLCEIAADPYLILSPADRGRARDQRTEGRMQGRIARGTFLVRKAGDVDILCQAIEVPVREDDGRIREWSGLIVPARSSDRLPPAIVTGLEEAVQGHQLRAARALLGWSMTDLARVSGLSLSSVRRLEEDPAHCSGRVRSRAFSVLRGGGIRFIAMEDGSIALARA